MMANTCRLRCAVVRAIRQYIRETPSEVQTPDSKMLDQSLQIRFRKSPDKDLVATYSIISSMGHETYARRGKGIMQGPNYTVHF